MEEIRVWGFWCWGLNDFQYFDSGEVVVDFLEVGLRLGFTGKVFVKVD